MLWNHTTLKEQQTKEKNINSETTTNVLVVVEAEQIVERMDHACRSGRMWLVGSLPSRGCGACVL